MKTTAVVLAMFCVTSELAAQPTQAPPALREYLVDFGHTIVEFSIGFAFSRIKGRFTSAKGAMLYDEARPQNSSITLVIDSKSIDTGWPHRDEHLRTSDFFDVEKYPTIVFESDRLTPNGNGWIADGRLTMHGVTKTVAIPFHLLRPPIRSSESGWMIINLEGQTRLARADFGITGGSTYNSWFTKARAATMADSVDVSLEVEAYRADAASQRSAPIEAALERIRANGVQSQIDRLAEAKRTRPSEVAALLNGGDFVTRALIATGRIADAVAMARAFAELFPDATRAAAVYGLALSISGDANGAGRQYERMKQIFRPPVVDPAERFPQVDESWYYLDQLAQTAIEWGKAPHAVPLARTLAALYPAIARAHTTLGATLAAAGDAKGAAAAYAKALEVDPNETRALEWRRRLSDR
jgi:polyisoprenoid-binding protein YceI